MNKQFNEAMHNGCVKVQVNEILKRLLRNVYYFTSLPFFLLS